jgi:hypothetical protein
MDGEDVERGLVWVRMPTVVVGKTSDPCVSSPKRLIECVSDCLV